MTRDEWHRERMEQERMEDAQVEARESFEMLTVACMVIPWMVPAEDWITHCYFPLGTDGVSSDGRGFW